MNINLRNFTQLFFTSLIFIPILYCFIFSIPSSDDLFRFFPSSTFDGFNDYINFVKDWNQNHNGRFMNALLCSIPMVYKKYCYGICNLLITTFIGYAIFKLLIKFIKNRYDCLLLSMLAVLTIFLIAATPVEIFYNFSRTSVYSLYLALTILTIGNVGNYLNNPKKKSELGIYILIIISIGTFELSLFSIPIILSYYVLFHHKKEELWFYLKSIIVFLVTGIKVILNTANHARADGYSNHANISFSMQKTIETVLDFFAHFFLDPVNLGIVVFWIAILFLFGNSFLLNQKKLFKIFYVVILLNVFMFSSIFFWFYSKGFNVLQDRMSNILFVCVLTGIALFVFLIIKYFGGKYLKFQSSRPFLQWIIPLMILGAVPFNQNYRLMVKEIFSKDIKNSHQEAYEIEYYLRASDKSKKLIYPQLEYNPKTTRMRYFIKPAYTEIYGFKSVKRNKSLTIKDLSY